MRAGLKLSRAPPIFWPLTIQPSRSQHRPSRCQRRTKVQLELSSRKHAPRRRSVQQKSSKELERMTNRLQRFAEVIVLLAAASLGNPPARAQSTPPQGY